MFKWFFVHQWKETTRSLFRARKLWFYFFFGLLLLYLSANLFIAGLYLDQILKTLFPAADPLVKFSGFLLYYFLVDLFARFFYQGFPVFSIVPYLHLPVERKKIFNFILFKSLFSPFNWLPLLVFVPFVFRTAWLSGPFWIVFGWLLAVIMFILINNFIAFYLRQISDRKMGFVALFLLVAGTVFYLDHQDLIPLSGWFGAFMVQSASHLILLIIPACILAAAVVISRNLIRRNAYLENIVRDKGREFNAGDRLSFLGKYGNIGDLLRLEIKLIWRNKRPRTYVFMCLFFIVYGFVFYSNKMLNSYDVMLIFIGVFLSAIFLLQYGQLLIAWESEYFDFLMTRNITAKDYFMAKYWLFIISEVFAFLISLPFGLFNREIIYVNFALLLFNMGISTYIVLYMSVYNKAPVEINKSAFMNYQGVKVSQFLPFILVTGLPLLLHMPFSSSGHSTAGFIFLGAAGLTGIFFRKPLIGISVKKFLAEKYKIAISFRNV